MSNFNPLSIPDLKKDQNRVIAFIDKVKKGEVFATVDKGEVIIPKDQLNLVEFFMTVDNGYPKSGTSTPVKTNKGELTIPKDFLKTGEFGGRGAGSGTSAETMAMNYFNDNLNKKLTQVKRSFINLSINGRTVQCAAMVKTEGKYQGREPKSDMTIVDHKGNPVAFISHKAGRSAKDYQQYGGLSYAQYQNNTDIQSFMDDVIDATGGELSTGQSYYRPIKDNKLIREAMYGPEYSRRVASISNVDEFHLGNMELSGSGRGPYTIQSVHKGTNGEIPKGEFTAVFFARFQGSRGDARAGGRVLKKARVGIFPLAKISGTSIKI